MAGRKGTIHEPCEGMGASGEAYSIRLDDCGCLFICRSENLQAGEQFAPSSASSATGNLQDTVEARLDVLERKSVAMEHQAATLHAMVEATQERVEVLVRRRRRRATVQGSEA